MKIVAIGLAAVLALGSSAAFAQGGMGGHRHEMRGGPAPSGFATGPAAAGLGNNAGSIAAGANSGQNPSGNSFINTSPSGSTLTQQ